MDINGDGDLLDSVRFYTPSNTNTKRYGVNASLIWDFAENHRARVAYTYDYGKHRQTGAFGYLDADGNPENPFGGRKGRKVLTADKVLVVTQAAGEALLADEKWSADYVRAVHAALGKSMIRVDVPSMSITY